MDYLLWTVSLFSFVSLAVGNYFLFKFIKLRQQNQTVNSLVITLLTYLLIRNDDYGLQLHFGENLTRKYLWFCLFRGAGY